MKPFLSAVIVFGVSFAVLNLIEIKLHKLTKNKDKSYRWGVWTFSILLAIYTFITALGR